MMNRAVAIQSFLLMMGLSVALADGFSFSQQHITPSLIGTAATTPTIGITTRGGSNVSSSSRPISFSQRQSYSLALLSTTRGGGGGSLNRNTPRGGVRYAEPSDDDLPVAEGMAAKTLSAFGSIWGSMGVVYILAKAIKRVLPIAMEPLKAGSTVALSNMQWG
jgi:hypothetical protein